MKKILTSVFLISFLHCYAQITLTYNNSGPKIGLISISVEADTNQLNSIDLTKTGPNTEWDFKNINGITSPDVVTYLSPSGNAFLQCFPTANIMGSDDSGGATFFSSSASGFSLLGTSTGDSCFILGNGLLAVKFPFTYNSSFKDTLAFKLPPPFDTLTGITLFSDVKADGYGKVSTILGTFDALRVLRKAKGSQEISPGINVVIEQESFEWLTNQHPIPVFSVIRQTVKVPIIGINRVTYTGTILTDVRSETEDNNLQDFIVFPNPAQDEIIVSNKLNNSTKIDVYNLTGQNVGRYALRNEDVKNNVKIDISNLQIGIYHFNISDKEGKIIGKGKFVKSN